jgi:hypothetical protein
MYNKVEGLAVMESTRCVFCVTQPQKRICLTFSLSKGHKMKITNRMAEEKLKAFTKCYFTYMSRIFVGKKYKKTIFLQKMRSKKEKTTLKTKNKNLRRHQTDHVVTIVDLDKLLVSKIVHMKFS